MIRLTRDNGDTIFLNPDHISMIEPILGGSRTRIATRSGHVDVQQSVEEVGALIQGVPFPAIELKVEAAPVDLAGGDVPPVEPPAKPRR